MALSPEEQYHQDIYNEENADTNIYMPKYPDKPVKESVPTKKLTVGRVLMKQMSKLNEKIINYFKDNLADLNANDFIFEWIAIHDEEIEYYEEQGIEKFPVLIVNDINITGVSNILKYLDAIKLNGSKKATTLTKSRTAVKKETDEEMHDFLLQELSNDKDDDDDDDDSFSNNMSRRISEMSEARQANGMAKSNDEENDEDIFSKTSSLPTLAKSKEVSTSSSTNKSSLNTVDLIKKTSKGGGEDDMMLKFYQNHLV